MPYTKGEGTERGYFYGSVWAAVVAQAILLVCWKLLPGSRAATLLKLAVYAAALSLMALLARRGVLPRTRPIVPGELMAAD
jgi:hypothetical protein